MRIKAVMAVLGLCLVATLGFIFVQSATATTHTIEPFFGDYIGEATFTDEGIEYKRDLGVSISKTKKGFRVVWKTTTHKPNGGGKTKTYDIDFIPTKRDNVYSSAMKTNVFGGRTALDPLEGDPYVWARITDDTLTVFALIVTEEGGYEMQVYDRTLAPDGLDLKFSRNRNGKNLRLIEARLKRL